jgi:hypothetical protein
MFIGHHGLAFAAKAAAPRANLGVLFLATMWLDIVWPVFLLLGLEEVRVEPGITKVSPFDFVSYPYSHSLLFATLWALGFGRLMWALTHDGRISIVSGLLVLSHWILDFIVHRPDLPLVPESERYGLGLWNSWTGTLSLELAIFLGGLFFYWRATRSLDRIGSIGLFVFAVFLLTMYALSLIAPPPPDAHVLAWGALSVLLLVAWAWWLDKHREPRWLPPQLS